jgi:hypothetical protein
MKELFIKNKIPLIFFLTLTGFFTTAYIRKDSSKNILLKNKHDNTVAPLVLQKLNYSENPIDIPNPDRGFYRSAELVVPVDSGATPGLPELSTTISGTKVPVEARIIYMEFDLKNFSSNAPLNGKPIGPWGEMHSSSYARTKEGYHWLLKALLGYVPPSRSILAHAGGVMAWYNVEYNTNYSFTHLMPAPARGTPAQRFGMFNDSYSAGSRSGGGYNDNGSLSEGYALIGSGKESDFNRNAALTWIRNQNNFYGGETVGPGPDDNIYPRFPNVPYEAAYAQTTHLNTSWNQRTYKLWGDFVYNKENVTAPFTPPHDGVTRTAIFDPLYDGRSGMEYMRDRLGYRFVLRESKASEWVNQNGALKFEGKVQNVGFGNVINKKKVSVILKTKDGANTYVAITNLDARDWRADLDSRAENTAAWRDLNFSVDLNAFGKVPPGDYDIFLKINDPKETTANRRCIQFANHNIWDSSIAANQIGSVKVDR